MTWTFNLADGVHTAHLEHGHWSGKRMLTIDGNLVVNEDKRMDFRGEHRFRFKGHRGRKWHQGLLIIRSQGLTGLTYSYFLVIDGKSVKGEKYSWLADPMPRWACAFIVACILIPVMSLGGAIPIVIGAGGAYACGEITRGSSQDSKSRILICLGVTLLCWAMFIAFLWTIGGLPGRS